MIKQLYKFLLELRTKLAKRLVSNVLLFTPDQYRYANMITSAMVIVLIVFSLCMLLISLFGILYGDIAGSVIILLLLLQLQSAALADVIYRSNILDFEYQRKLRAIQKAKHVSKHIDFDNTTLTLDEIDNLYESIRPDVDTSM